MRDGLDGSASTFAIATPRPFPHNSENLLENNIPTFIPDSTESRTRRDSSESLRVTNIVHL
jgi:hypothetical protein